MTFIAGDRATGRKLRLLQPIYAYLSGDVSTNFSAVLADVPGLTLPVRANTRYTLDGYIAYTSSSAADIKFTFQVPGTATGRFGMFPVAQTATSSTGNLEGFFTLTFGDAQGVAGSTSPMLCQPHGQLRTGDVPGVMQMQFAQVTATASTTTVAAGSWLRLVRLSDALQP